MYFLNETLNEVRRDHCMIKKSELLFVRDFFVPLDHFLTHYGDVIITGEYTM